LKPSERPNRSRAAVSPLTQGRGLKPVGNPLLVIRGQSPLTQGRGLKQAVEISKHKGDKVAPHAGAWIETRPWTT